MVALRVPGHTLKSGGAPYSKPDCWLCRSLGHYGGIAQRVQSRSGHGRCSCGELSPHESTIRARMQWHRTHKVEVTLMDLMDEFKDQHEGTP